ncbi:MAG TPA: hypothetical protein VF215_08880, partial [Thermoanaerobaculia bacterium]
SGRPVMETGLHFVGYLLAFFLTFLYFPNLVFKYGAEYSIDLGRRRDSGELEEFFSAVIPCLLLNAFTYLLLWFAKVQGCPWRAVPDYNILSNLLSDKGEAAKELFLDGSRRYALLGYIVVLLFIAWYNGVVYGYGIKRKLAQPRVADRIPPFTSPSSGLKRVGARTLWILSLCVWAGTEIACLLTAFVWHKIYHEEMVELYRYSVQKPAVFVRLRDGRLYYGIFERYDKAVSGSIESITIGDVRRYCYDEIDECLSDGRLPIARFQGPLRISVNDVTDIHTVPPNHFQTIERRYEAKRVRSLGRDLLTSFAGQRDLSVIDVYRRHAGGTLLTQFHYRQALRYLEHEQFIVIVPSTIGASPRSSPPNDALVTFPARVTSQFDMFFGRSTEVRPTLGDRPARNVDVGVGSSVSRTT